MANKVALERDWRSLVNYSRICRRCGCMALDGAEVLEGCDHCPGETRAGRAADFTGASPRCLTPVCSSTAGRSPGASGRAGNDY